MSGNGQATQAEREAARWIARLEAADVSLNDHRRFRRWLNAASENRPAYEAVAKTWDHLDALKHLSLVLPAPKLSRRGLLLGSGAAALAVGGVAVLGLSQQAQATPYATAIGERKTVTLADGSTAELNADTRMRASIAAHERRVQLDHGEALFDVRQEGERPFVVATAFGELHARAASFLVKLGADGARTTIIRGVVEAIRKSGPLALFAAPQSLTVHASQEISFQGSGILSSALPREALERRLAWREGMLAFDGESLRDAALEIERQTGVHFEFAEASIGAVRIGGYISATDVDAFIQLVDENLGLKVERRSSKLAWVRRA